MVHPSLMKRLTHGQAPRWRKSRNNEAASANAASVMPERILRLVKIANSPVRHSYRWLPRQLIATMRQQSYPKPQADIWVSSVMAACRLARMTLQRRLQHSSLTARRTSLSAAQRKARLIVHTKQERQLRQEQEHDYCGKQRTHCPADGNCRCQRQQEGRSLAFGPVCPVACRSGAVARRLASKRCPPGAPASCWQLRLSGQPVTLFK